MRATKLVLGHGYPLLPPSPLELGLLLRSATVYSSSCRPVRSSGSWVIFLPSPLQTRRYDIDISVGGAINVCEGKISLFSTLIFIVVYGKLGVSC